MPDDPIEPPRFPYVGALLCAACLGAAVWTWMRFSYCWGVPPAALTRDMMGRYVRLRGAVVTRRVRCSLFDASGNERPMTVFVVRVDGDPDVWTAVLDVADGPAVRPRMGGRVIQASFQNFPLRDGQPIYPLIDADVSRFHGASVAGLVVGAMGVFVFTVALRHWLGERRRFREQATA